jgi:hypothetical protein
MFLPLGSGDLLRWEAGPQGGFHVFGAVRIAAEVLAPLSEDDRADVLHTHTLTSGEETLVARTVRAGRFLEAQGGYEARSVLLVLEPGLSPYRISRRPLLYTVRVEVPSAGVIASSVVVRTACCD